VVPAEAADMDSLTLVRESMAEFVAIVLSPP
jgi:hypothetical protein